MLYNLPAGHIITATVNDGATATIKQVEDSTIGAIFKTEVTFGSYQVARTFNVTGNVSVTIAPVTDSLTAIFKYGTTAPEVSRQAELLIDPAGDDNAVQLYANEYGNGGNLISVTLVDPSALSQALAVAVKGFEIVVSLKTGGGGAIESTAAEVVAAINASVPAASLVTASVGADIGVADDGSGVVTAMPQAFLTLGSGTGIGQVKKGCIYTNTTTGIQYTNTGTVAVPVWTATVTAAAFGAVSSFTNVLATLIYYTAGVPVNYTDGTPPATGEGTALKGALCIDYTNGFVYRNSGSTAQPTWVKLADAV